MRIDRATINHVSAMLRIVNAVCEQKDKVHPASPK